MNASIIAVGTELLFGQTVNTNAAFLSEELNNMGFNVLYHSVVGDNPARLKSTIERAFQASDIILLTGGLGPTQDDLTKEIVAEVFGAELYLDNTCLEDIKTFFASRKREMAENNVKQAMMPTNATVFRNESGTAPAFALEKSGKHAICFPGPPREMKWIYYNHAHAYLEKLMDKRMYYRMCRTIGIGESDLETVLLPLIDGQTDPTIATYAKEGECAFRVASQRDTIEEAKQAVDEMLVRVDELVGEFIYSYDDEELNEVVVRKLSDNKLSLTCAESCTGGMFATAITDVSGASEVFANGYITYSADAKCQELGVLPQTIADKSVVSPEVAMEMCNGALEKSGADMAISITGFAGPAVDAGREVGQAFVAYRFKDLGGTIELNTKRADREWNRGYFTLKMLQTVNNLIDGKLLFRKNGYSRKKK